MLDGLIESIFRFFFCLVFGVWYDVARSFAFLLKPMVALFFGWIAVTSGYLAWKARKKALPWRIASRLGVLFFGLFSLYAIWAWVSFDPRTCGALVNRELHQTK